MATVPIWLLGKHVTAVTWTPQAVDTAGLLSDTTPVQTVTNLVAEISMEVRYSTEQIQAMNDPRDNAVQISVGAQLRMVELMSNTASGNNLLATVGFTGGYYKASFARGGKVWTVYVLISDYTEDLTRSVGRATLTAEIVDAGATSLAYA